MPFCRAAQVHQVYRKTLQDTVHVPSRSFRPFRLHPAFLDPYVRSLVDQFIPKLRYRDATSRRADLMDVVRSAKWHPVSRYRTTTFISLTAVTSQNKYTREKLILHSCAYKPLVVVSSRRVYY